MKRLICGLLIGASLLAATLSASAMVQCSSNNARHNGPFLGAPRCGFPRAQAAAIFRCHQAGFPNCYVIPGSCRYFPPHC